MPLTLSAAVRSAPVRVTIAALWVAVLLGLMALDARIIEAAQALPGWVRSASALVSEIGHGGWMAQVTLATAILGALVARGAGRRAFALHGRLILRVAVVIFVILLGAGIFVQILKHMIGRPRPDLMAEMGAFALAPFRPGTPFNSFPSGHSTTMGALAVLMGFLVPRGRWVWVGVAVVVGLSRITALKHYASDVFAGLTLGAALAALGLSLLLAHGVLPPRGDRRWRALAARIGCSLRALAPDTGPWPRDALALAARLMLAALAALWLFHAVPGIDLAVAGLVHRTGAGGGLPGLEALGLAYGGLLRASLAAVLLLWLVALRRPEAVRLPARLWGFAVLALVLGPALLTAAGGLGEGARPRPVDLALSGGTQSFELAGLRIGAAPVPFVPGPHAAASVAMLACVALALFGRSLAANRAALALLGGVTAIGLFLPVAAGQAFVSDSVLAALAMALLALGLAHALRLRALRAEVTGAALGHDLRAASAYLRHRALPELRILVGSAVSLLAAVPAVLRGLRRPPGGWPALRLQAAFPAG
ncbi:phosphatase PAP2 family protein [Roseicyclus sp.]